MTTTKTSLKETLANLAREHGMACVLATVRNLLAAEADELYEMDHPEDTATAEKVEAIGGLVLQAAADYEAL